MEKKLTHELIVVIEMCIRDSAYSASLIFGLPCPGPFVKYHMGAGLVFLLRKSIIKLQFDVGKRRTE